MGPLELNRQATIVQGAMESDDVGVPGLDQQQAMASSHMHRI